MDSENTGEDRVSEALPTLVLSQRDYIQALYLEHYAALESYVLGLGFSEDAAEDWLQETFLVAIRRIETLQICKSPRAYLIRILRNVIGYHLRSLKYAAELANRLREPKEEYLDEVAPEVLYRGMVRDEELRLLLRFYRDGCSQKELAEELGIDLNACKKRIQRAKAHLLAALEQDKLL